MKGDADTWSISVALALLGIAHEERRTFAVLAFSNQVFYQVVVKPGEKLPGAALNLECDGGTEIDTAMSTGLSIIESNPGALHEADLVLVTDGCSASDRAPELKAEGQGAGRMRVGHRYRRGQRPARRHGQTSSRPSPASTASENKLRMRCSQAPRERVPRNGEVVMNKQKLVRVLSRDRSGVDRRCQLVIARIIRPPIHQ
jgi:hypothetical protein